MVKKSRKEIDFGQRKLVTQNRSKLVTVPKPALELCGFTDDSSVRIQVVLEENETYLKLSSVSDQKQKIKGDPSSMLSEP